MTRFATVALAADLLFASRIRAAAGAAGAELRLARTADDVLAAIAAGARRVLLDLDARHIDAPALIRAICESRGDVEVIAWVSHVRQEAIAAARAAGADRVLARSAFVQQLPALVAPDADA